MARIFKKKSYFQLVKFEDLVVNPKKRIKKILTFIGLAINNFPIKPTNSGKKYYGNNFKKKIKGVSSKNMLNWSERIDSYEQNFIDFYLGDEMRYWKYKFSNKIDLEQFNKLYEKINSKFFFKNLNI